MQNKKIAFLCTSYAWGGLEMNVIKLALGLKNAGIDISLYSEKGVIIAANAEKAGLDVIYISEHFKYFDLLSAKKLADILKSSNVNSLFVFHGRDMDLASNVKLFNRNIKLIYQQHMHVGRKKKDFFHNLRFARFDYWICPLNNLADDVVTLTNFNPSKIRIIPLGVDIKRLDTRGKSKSECREILNLDKEKFTFGIIGRIDRQKGQLNVLKAFNNLKNQFPDARLYITGEKTVGDKDNYLNEIMEYINENNLSQNVSVSISGNNIATIFGGIDCFILASNSETYGMVTIESMIAGVPVIASSLGGTSEILGHGQYGTLYNSGDISGLTDAMTEMLTDYKDKIEIAVKAKDYALQKFTAEIEIDLILKLLSAR